MISAEANGLKRKLQEERGAALAIALMVMLICSLLGAASILTTNTDFQIAINDRIYRGAFMNADAGIHYVKRQDVGSVAGFTKTELQDWNSNIAALSNDILFELPCNDNAGSCTNPRWIATDPSAGNADIYLVQVRGYNKNRRGSVLIEADIRVPPGFGEKIADGGSPTGY